MPVLVLRPVVYTSPVVANNTALKDHPQQVGACGLGCCFLRSSNIRARLRRARYLLCNRVATVVIQNIDGHENNMQHTRIKHQTHPLKKKHNSTRNNKQSNKEQRTKNKEHNMKYTLHNTYQNVEFSILSPIVSVFQCPATFGVRVQCNAPTHAAPPRSSPPTSRHPF